MKKAKILLITVLCLAGVASCFSYVFKKTPVSVRIDGVERVLMHEPRHYSFLVRQPDDSLELQEFWFTHKPRFITDVPAEATMWVSIKGYKVPDFMNTEILDGFCEMHIHSPKEVDRWYIKSFQRFSKIKPYGWNILLHP